MTNPVTQTLDLSNVINVSILPTSQNLALPIINTAALFTNDQPTWISSQAFQIYKDATQVALDFGTASKTFAIATKFFGQQPGPLNTGGYLAVVPRLQTTSIAATGTVQDIGFAAAATGTSGNSITVAYTTGGVAGQEVVTVVSNAISVQIASGSSTATQIATAINASPAAAALVAATVLGPVTNPQTGPVSPVSLAGGSASSVESVQSAIIRTLNNVYYFGILVDEEYHSTPAVLRALSAYVQTLDKMLFYASSFAADYAASGLLDLIRQASLTQTRCLYYSDGTALDTQGMAAAYAARGLSTDFSGSNTTLTMHLKPLVGLTPDQTVNQTALNTAQLAGVDVYVSVAGIPGVFSSGTNTFFDELYNEKWFKFALQTAGFNYLATVSTKIPQTEQGMEGLKNVYRKICDQAISNGYVAPGSWTSANFFGNPAALVRNIADFGYYVYSQPITAQLQADRVARKAPLVQIAVKSAGAIQSSNVVVNVNL